MELFTLWLRSGPHPIHAKPCGLPGQALMLKLACSTQLHVCLETMRWAPNHDLRTKYPEETGCPTVRQVSDETLRHSFVVAQKQGIMRNVFLTLHE